MTDYTYPNTGFTFGARDSLAPGNAEKAIIGSQFDPEFNALVASVNSKLNIANPVFTGTLSGGIIDGGTY
jgi:hypothetical protein